MHEPISCWRNHIHNTDAKISREKWLEDHLWVTPLFKSYWKVNMKKIHVDGISESFDFESTDACENFLEMIKTPFVGQRRTND
jgi:hypothetical protein